MRLTTRKAQTRPGAYGLARMRADAAADAGEGQLAADQLQRLGVLARADQRHVALDIDAGGARGATGRNASLVDGKRARHGLREKPVDRLAAGEELIELVGYRHGADGRTFAAAGALTYVHVARLLLHLHLEIADVARNLGHFGVGQQGDVGVAGGQHHFGCQNAGRAVQGGEGLVQLSHAAADGGVLFYQEDVVSGVSNGQRRLDAGDTSAHHQRDRCDRHLALGQRLLAGYATDCAGDEGLGLGSTYGLVLRNPGAMLADVSHRQQVGVEPGLGQRSAEGRLVQAWGTRGHDDAIQPKFGYIMCDRALAGGRAHVSMLPSHDDVRQRSGVGHGVIHIHRVGNVGPAVANVDADADGAAVSHLVPPGTRQLVLELNLVIGRLSIRSRYPANSSRSISTTTGSPRTMYPVSYRVMPWPR